MQRFSSLCRCFFLHCPKFYFCLCRYCSCHTSPIICSYIIIISYILSVNRHFSHKCIIFNTNFIFIYSSTIFCHIRKNTFQINIRYIYFTQKKEPDILYPIPLVIYVRLFIFYHGIYFFSSSVHNL